MKQLSLFDLFDEFQSSLNSSNNVSEEQSNISSNITANNDCPIIRQWNEIKAKYPDAILLFRVGDFYEAYNDDAVFCSKELAITLVNRANSNIRFCGFPFHALDTYLPKLVRAGKRVAICDQIEEPYHKNLVKRNPAYKQIK